MQIDLAVAIVVGTAFTAVVKAFVSLSFGSFLCFHLSSSALLCVRECCMMYPCIVHHVHHIGLCMQVLIHVTVSMYPCQCSMGGRLSTQSKILPLHVTAMPACRLQTSSRRSLRPFTGARPSRTCTSLCTTPDFSLETSSTM